MLFKMKSIYNEKISLQTTLGILDLELKKRNLFFDFIESRLTRKEYSQKKLGKLSKEGEKFNKNFFEGNEFILENELFETSLKNKNKKMSFEEIINFSFKNQNENYIIYFSEIYEKDVFNSNLKYFIPNKNEEFFKIDYKKNKGKNIIELYKKNEHI